MRTARRRRRPSPRRRPPTDAEVRAARDEVLAAHPDAHVVAGGALLGFCVALAGRLNRWGGLWKISPWNKTEDNAWVSAARALKKSEAARHA